MLRKIRADVAAYIGAETQDVVFVENASSAINGVVRSINFKPTDKLLMLNIAYGTFRRNSQVFHPSKTDFEIF